MSLNIVFVTETYPPEVNGVAMTVGRLVQGLRAAGHHVTVVRPRQSGESPEKAGYELVRSLPIPGYPGLRFGLPAGGLLRRLWRQSRPDVVHVVTEGPLGWSAVNAARALKIPVTSGFHTNFDRYSVHYGLGFLRPAVAAYLRTLHRRTRATMVPTEALAADLAGEGIQGVRVVGRGVDTQLYRPEQRCEALRQRWLQGGRGPVCLYVGRLAPEKNLALLEASFAALVAVQPDARMVWVGDGPARSALAARHPTHLFTGQQVGEDLARHYASADLFLFPSLTETYGNVVAEAMASGLPVVAYRSAAAAALIVNGENGVVVAPGDEAAYLRAVLDLMAAPQSGPRLGMAARERMLSHSWSRVVQDFLAVLDEAISGQNSACARSEVMAAGPRSAL